MIDAKKLLELAGRMKNPVVKNALLAAAVGRDREAAVAEARKRVAVEAREAERDGKEARAEQERICREADRDGTLGQVEVIRKGLVELKAMQEADSRRNTLEDARDALREIAAAEGKGAQQ